ncbi:MAG TPA: nuclear transport factor 2 family protein [Brevibacterium sp.]|nr:nuclear transport factor 2 family protein [Brevibacterium sp.]
MEITLPTDCGNAPRIAIVSDFVVAWASGDTAAMSPWLADDISWSIVGEETHHGADAVGEVLPTITPERITIASVITHGRLASCDGFFDDGTTRVDFSHAFRFTNTTKTGRVAEVRSYLIESQSH